MEAVTDVVFRHVVKRWAGAPDIFFTEFAMLPAGVHAGDKAYSWATKTDDEQPLIKSKFGVWARGIWSFAKHRAKLGFNGIRYQYGMSRQICH